MPFLFVASLLVIATQNLYSGRDSADDLSKNGSFISFPHSIYKARILDFFSSFTTEQVSCHQRFIGLIRNGVGSQVLGVGDSWKECFVGRNTLQLPAANFLTMHICQRGALGKHLSFCWHIL